MPLINYIPGRCKDHCKGAELAEHVVDVVALSAAAVVAVVAVVEEVKWLNWCTNWFVIDAVDFKRRRSERGRRNFQRRWRMAFFFCLGFPPPPFPPFCFLGRGGGGAFIKPPSMNQSIYALRTGPKLTLNDVV